MSPIPPFWFKQRQCKAEPLGENMLKVTGPNLPEAFLYVRAVEGRWVAGVRRTQDGPDLAAIEPEPLSIQDAWNTAFELYRVRMIC
jgi:hypothetical protein